MRRTTTTTTAKAEAARTRAGAGARRALWGLALVCITLSVVNVAVTAAPVPAPGAPGGPAVGGNNALPATPLGSAAGAPVNADAIADANAALLPGPAAAPAPAPNNNNAANDPKGGGVKPAGANINAAANAASGGGGGNASSPVAIPEALKPLYDGLVTAASTGQAWDKLAIDKFDATGVGNVLAALIQHITTTALGQYQGQYPSIGHTLPRRLDLAGLQRHNANVSAADWATAFNVTRTTLAKTPNDYNLELWRGVTAYAELLQIEEKSKNATSVWDLDPATQERYLASAREYIGQSAQIAWINSTGPTFAELINRTELPAKLLDKANASWIAPLLAGAAEAPKYAPMDDDVATFVELALLAHVSAEGINNLPDAELGGTIADYFITSTLESLRKGSITAMAKVVRDPLLVGYAEIARKYCTPAHTLRFCLLPAFADQAIILTSAEKNLYDASKVTKLPSAAADLKRQDFIVKLSSYFQAQTVSFETTKAFHELQESVRQAASDLVYRSRTATYEKTVEMQEGINTKMTDMAKDFLSQAESDRTAGGNDYQSKVQRMKEISTEVQGQLDPYLERVKFIAEKALKQAQAEKVSGFFGFLLKIINLFNPIMWVIDPGQCVDVLRSGRDLSKQFEKTDNVKELIKIIQNGLIPKVQDLLKKIQTLEPKLKELRDAIEPIVTAKDIQKDQLKDLSSKFLRALSGYESPVLMTDVDVLEELFVNVQNELCQIAKKRALNECAQVKQDVKIFDKLSQVVSLGSQALDNLANMARGAVTEQSAKIFKAGVEKSYNESVKALENLQADWDKQTKEDDARWKIYKRKLGYQQAVIGMGMTRTSARAANAALLACNFLTYLNGGVAVPDCLPMYQNPAAVLDLKKIASFVFETKPQEYKGTAFIPTMPSADGDSRYLDLGRMMEPRVNVTFQVPQDVDWLRKYKWVPSDYDIKNTVAFISRFQVLLPASQVVSEGGSGKRIVNVVTSAKVADLGPAVNNKVYEIPERQFVFSYEESAEAASGCSTKQSNPYQTCNSRLPGICPISMGDVDTNSDTPLPSLFSPLNIFVSFDTTSTEKSLSFAGVRGSAPIPVPITLRMYKLSPNQPRPQRGPPASATNSSSPAPAGTAGSEANVPPAEEETADAEAEAGAEEGAGAGTAPAGDVEAATPTDAAATPATRLRRLQNTNAGSTTATTVKRCCNVGSYLVDWELKKCAMCPPGLVSQMGGLYCVLPPSGGGTDTGATTGGAAISAPAPVVTKNQGGGGGGRSLGPSASPNMAPASVVPAPVTAEADAGGDAVSGLQAA